MNEDLSKATEEDLESSETAILDAVMVEVNAHPMCVQDMMHAYSSFYLIWVSARQACFHGSGSNLDSKANIVRFIS